MRGSREGQEVQRPGVGICGEPWWSCKGGIKESSLGGGSHRKAMVPTWSPQMLERTASLRMGRTLPSTASAANRTSTAS